MKTPFLAAVIFCASSSLLNAEDARIGGPIADFTLLDTNAKPVKVSAGNDRPTVVIFFSTRCPMSNAFNYRRNVLYHDFGDRVKFVMVDANANESLEEVRGYARAVEFDFPVYKDANNVLADQLGARVTTDTFVIDAAGILRYHGYMEDSPSPLWAKIRGLRLAIEAVLDGRPVATPQNKALGCSIIRTGAVLTTP